MNSEWQEYLVSAGGSPTATGQLVFAGDNELAADNMVCDLSGDIVLRIEGADAESFLQGQFSNDLLALGIPCSQLSTWSNPKGRVMILFRLIRDAEGYLIKMSGVLADQIQKRLKMYVLMAKVSIEQQPDFVCFGVSGSNGARILQKFTCELPADVDGTIQHDGTTVYRVPGGTDRFEVITSTRVAKEIWQQLADCCQLAGESVWRLHNIDAGVPSIGAGTSEAFVLQMLNLQHINGVSFKKGCFPGQEVVARMQYLGKLKRRMYRAQGSMTASGLPLPGAETYNENVASPVGKIVDAQAVGDGTFRLLLVNAIAATQQPIFLDKEATQQIELLDLPYSLENEE